MSVSDVRGFGAHAAHPPRNGEPSEVDAFQVRLRLEIFCRLEDTTAIVETLRRAAHTGHAGDGKIFAGPVSLAYRVRTGEWGVTALLCAAPATAPPEES